MMTRLVSFIALVTILIVIASIFFTVMAGFILPLFLAVMLVVMFRPLHRWLLARFGRFQRIAAGLTTSVIVLILLLPIAFLLFEASREGISLYQQLGAEKLKSLSFIDSVHQINERFNLDLNAEQLQEDLVTKLQSWITPLIVGTTHYAIRIGLAVFVMVVSLYYFLADGRSMLDGLMGILPLERHHLERLLHEFDTITRAVVMASVVTALVQGLLIAVGYFFAGLGSLFLLSITTVLFAMVPFVGTAGIWIPVSLWVYFYKGEPVTAISLAIYCAIVAFVTDHFLKPQLLGGRSNLHPLLALLSVIGGIEALGPIGIFIGPMAASFLYALLVMVNKELATFGEFPWRSKQDTTKEMSHDAS